MSYEIGLIIAPSAQPMVMSAAEATQWLNDMHYSQQSTGGHFNFIITADEELVGTIRPYSEED